jgi:hypothetical protein
VFDSSIIIESISRHAYHKYYHAINNIAGSDTNEKSKFLNIFLSYALGNPWAVMIILTNANIALSAVICLSLHWNVTFFTISIYTFIYLLTYSLTS